MSVSMNPAVSTAHLATAATPADVDGDTGGLSTTAKVVLGASLGLGAVVGGLVGFRSAGAAGNAVARAAIGTGIGLAAGGVIGGLAALGGATHSDDHYYYDPYPYVPEPYYPEPYYPDPYYPDYGYDPGYRDRDWDGAREDYPDTGRYYPGGNSPGDER